ncbi:MAG TPA: acyltransferase [Phenylobacterium sp.]|nr:acyltransferase [Phenylobacterium sp.]
MSDTGAAGRRRFEALDGWRGVCALLVALWHFQLGGHVDQVRPFSSSFLFVDFFFVLSGFVIAYSAEDGMDEGGSRVTFLWKRFARVWPLHAAMLAVMIGQEFVRQQLEGWSFPEGRRPGDILANLTLVHGLGFEDRLTWNWPSWSISVEMALYVVFALIFMAVPRRWRTWLAAGIVISALSVIGLFSPRFMGGAVDFGLARGLAGFFMGYLVQRLWRVSPAQTNTWGEAAMAAAVVGFLSVSGETVLSLGAPVVFGAAVWVFASEGGAISRALKSGPGLKLGAWSYSIYLIHAPIIISFHIAYRVAKWPGGQITKAVEALGSPWVGDLINLVFLGLLLAIAPLTYRFVEMPGRRLFAPSARRAEAAQIA